ncbi:MAG: sigma-70 family RNA polymerase sigma factor [Deltaproteobacteria bacterium]
MTVPGGLDPGLVELYELFGQMRQTATPETRRQLGFQVILHPAAMKRLRCAVTRYRKQFASRHAEFAEVLQETLLRLVQNLSAGSLPYDDQGIKRFSGWYFTLCRNVSLEVLRKYCRPKPESLDQVEEKDLPPARQPTLTELQWDEVVLAVSQIGHPKVKAAMIDLLAGRTEAETALAYDLSQTAVSRLRQKGVELVQRACHGEKIGHS